MEANPTPVRGKLRIGKSLQYLFLSLYSVICLYPIVWVLLLSFRSEKDIFANPFGFPSVWIWNNYADAWRIGHLGTAYFNSIFVSLGTVAVTSIFAATSAYVLTRIPVKGRAILFMLLISGIFIPQQSALLPVFLLLKQMDFINKPWTLTVVYVAFNLSVAVFILSSFLKDLPKELEEAALMDGAKLNQIFFKIIFPICRPPIATAGILVFLHAWNEFMFATLYTSVDKLKTLPVAMASFENEFGLQYAYISAGIIMAMFPVITVFVLFQKQVVQGMTSGSVKA